MADLHIYDPRDRMLVGAADRLLAIASAIASPFRRRQRPRDPRRILLLRLERIGDLLMALPAIADVRALAPAAEIDLVVGGWNAALAKAIPSVSRVEIADARWLDRDGGGGGMLSMLRTARGWRTRRYDLAINFEPDIRSNLMLASSGAAWTAGYASGGGGPLLDLSLDYDTRAHTTENARRLVRAVFERAGAATSTPGLVLPDAAVRDARARLARSGRGPLVGIHASGGRAIKQWDVERFGEVGALLARERQATIVLTGAPADRALVERVKTIVPSAQTIDVAGNLDLVTLGALLRELDLLITGDTGPMHLAAAVGTPIVAVFGPSDPARYAPLGPFDRVVRVDLPCSPCNRIRLPPARCVGHTPDCLAHIGAEQVFVAAVAALDESRERRQPHTGHASA